MKKIPLTQGLFALVSDEDFVHLMRWLWLAVKQKNTYYAVRRNKKPDGKIEIIHMHRVVMNAPDGLEVDHRNRNGLDNQRHNLRIATSQQNSMNIGLRSNNTSGHIGVCWDKRSQRWKAKLTFNYKTINIGYFDEKDLAIAARKDAEKKYYGEFAPQN